jgi:hypothetical protein
MAMCGVGDALFDQSVPACARHVWYTHIAVVSHVATVPNPILVLPYSLWGGTMVYGILLLIVVAFTSVTVASSVDTVLLYWIYRVMTVAV